MKKIKIELTVDQVNTVLAVLGQQPYVKVAELIQTLQQQGAAQLKVTERPPVVAVEDIVNHTELAENGR